ncbi:MAG: Ig-like domain-containing protein [Acutalibacteraceae bacterium]
MPKKSKARKTKLRTLLLSVITVALLASIATFVGVGASGLNGGNVSDSDNGGLFALFETKSTNGTEVDALPSNVGDAQIDFENYTSPLTLNVTSASPVYIEYNEGILLFDTPKNGVYECEIEDIFGNVYVHSASPITVFSIDCWGAVPVLNINPNANLTELYCSDVELEQLNISENSTLQKLDCSYNNINYLDLSGCTGLKELDCSDNQLTEKELSVNTSTLEKLVCNDNKFKSFSTASYASSLKYINFSGNKLESLDVSQCSSLTYLNVSSNSLSFDSLKLPNSLSAGDVVGLDSQNLTLYVKKYKPDETINVAVGTGSVYTWYLSNGTAASPTVVADGKFSFGSEYIDKYVYCIITNPALPEMTIRTNTLYITNTDTTACNAQMNNCDKGDYIGFYLSGPEPYPVYIDWGDGEKVLVDEACYDPDNYTTWCEGNAKGSTVKIYTEDVFGMFLNYGSYDLSNSKGLKFVISTFGDIENLNLSGCTALMYVEGEESIIKSMNFSGCTALESIDCLGPLTESIDLTGCSALTKLTLSNIALSELDVSDCTELTTLDVSTWDIDETPTRLTKLDVSKNVKLEFLQCFNQNLTALDLSKNTALTDISIGYNNLTFSKLKLFDGWESCQVKLMDHQTYVYTPSEVSAGTTIDLSSEYSVGGKVTQYKWYSADKLDDEYGTPVDGKEITPATAANGKFTFGNAVAGKYVYCVMTNDAFPGMDVTTTPIKIKEGVVCKHTKTKLVGKKAATCFEEGYTGDKVCTSCGEIVTPGTSIEKLAHTFKKYVSNNDATCISDGTKTAKCEKCDATNTITDFGSKKPHTYGVCSYIDENTHRYTCTVEGCGHEEILPHRGGTATYTEQAVCMDCGGSYGELVPHDIKLNVETITMLKDKQFAVTTYTYPSNSTKKITWSSSDENIAAVDQSGKITAVAKGKATITAVIEGGNSAQIKVTVIDSWKKNTESITINKSAYTLTIHRNKLNPTVSLSAKIKGNSTGRLWYSDDINVATVSSSGRVTAVSAGTANIYCRTAGGEVVASSVITVNDFRIDSDNMRDNIIYVNAGDTCKVSLTNTTSDNSAVTWKSSNAKYASIDANGNVTAYKKGTVTITVTTANKSKDTCKLVIVNPTESLKMNKTSASIYIGRSVSLKASLVTRGSNDPVFWTSSNSSIATVSSKGVVKGLKQGKVTITATSFNGEKTTAEITVMSKAAALQFTEVTPALFMGGHTGQFTVKITSPVNSNDTIKWTTSNKRVIEIINVSPDGKTVTIKSGNKGTATITAKAGSGKSIKYKVTSVDQAADSMTLNKTEASIYVGKTVTFKATKVEPKGCNDIIIWSSSNEGVATVTPDGVVKGVGQGNVTITATMFGSDRVLCKIPVKVMTKAVSMSVDKTSSTVAVNGTDKITVTEIVPTGCNDAITWSTSNKSVVTVTPSSDGTQATVTGLKKGTATITVKTGSGKYKKIKVTVTA